jgi:quinol monooxygenase YgiN
VARHGLHGAIRAHAGHGQELLDHLLEAARVVEHAPGCELYLVSRDTEDPDTVWITEVWASQADHEASLGLPAVGELIGRARGVIAGMGPSHAFVPVGGLGLDAGAKATESGDQSSAGGG